MKTLILFLITSVSWSQNMSVTEGCHRKIISAFNEQVIKSNIANVNTTRTPEGGPYQRKTLVCETLTHCEAVSDTLSVVIKYEPGHPDANEEGYVKYPDIDLNEELEMLIQNVRDLNVFAELCPFF